MTKLLPKQFGIFRIKIREKNCIPVSFTLSRALVKPWTKQNKLRLNFKGNLNLIMRDILQTHKQNISSLNIEVVGNERFLKFMHLNLLESLSVCLRRSEYKDHRIIIESLMNNHAKTLTEIKIISGRLEQFTNKSLFIKMVHLYITT